MTTNLGFKMSLEVRSSLIWKFQSFSEEHQGRGPPVFHTSRKSALCCMTKLTNPKKRRAGSLRTFFPCGFSPVVLRVWSLDQQQQHLLRSRQKCKFPAKSRALSIQGHARVSLSGAEIPAPAHSLKQLMIKYGDQTGTAMQGRVTGLMTWEGQQQGRGRTRSGLGLRWG